MGEQSAEPFAGASGQRARLAREVLGMIAAGPQGDPRAFDELAAAVFAHQYDNNAPYRQYCDLCGVTPRSLTSWHAVPAYPTDAFKREIVTSFPLSEAVLANLTSGTTSANGRGRIFRDETGRELIFTANRVMTGAYLFPDLKEGARCRILILAPGPQLAPSMGMAIGMEQTRLHFGTEDSAFLVGRSGVDVGALVRALRDAERSRCPVALIGSTSAFVYFMRSCVKKRMRFRLPAGSRLADGGGYRGRFGAMTREDYYQLAEEVLGVGAAMCANVLGMAESATNYPDDTIRSEVLGRSSPRHKPAPPWTRVRAIDPSTGAVLPHGEVGLLRHVDLANLPTVLAVQTDNLGYTDDRGGFEIVGRARVVDGRVDALPSERAVGPMGDRRVFRMLEAYVNFSIDFKMGRVAEETSGHRGERGGEPEDGGQVVSCPEVVDEMVAASEDPEAAARVDRALKLYGRIDSDDDPSRQKPCR